MAKRKCPLCFVNVPWTSVLARSYEMECPGCRAPLELSRYTRIVAGFGGIAGGMIAVQLTPLIFPGCVVGDAGCGGDCWIWRDLSRMRFAHRGLGGGAEGRNYKFSTPSRVTDRRYY